MTLFKTYFGVKKVKLFFILALVSNVLFQITNTVTMRSVSSLVTAIFSGDGWGFFMGAFIVSQIVYAICSYFNQIYRRKITQTSYSVLAEGVANRMLDADYDTYTSMSEGQMHSVMESVGNISNAGKAFMGVLESISSLIVTIVAIGVINWTLVIPVFAIYFLCSFPICYLNKKIGEYDKEVTNCKKSRTSEVQKIVSGFAEVRAASMQEHHRKTFEDLNRNTYNAIGAKQKAIAKYVFFLNMVDAAVSIIIVGFIIWRGGVSVDEGITLVLYGWSIMGPMGQFTDCLDEFSTYSAQFHVYKEFMEIEPKIEDGIVNLHGFESSITFKNVDFKYKESDMILKNVSFKIKKGEHIGVVGSSGCGKTTLLKLMERFYDPAFGSIQIDGIDIQDVTLKSLRNKIGYISQDPFIFDGTIEENITYGMPKWENAKVREACIKAAIFDFVNDLPDGFNTKVGPSGLKLSGGQKQRLALARIFLRDPDIILLDEATSALDNESENIIQDSINSMKGKTVIAVAHRLTTIKDFDKILVFDEHELAEEGSHEELMAANGIYRRMWEAKA